MRPLASWRGLVSVFLVLGFLAGPGQAQETNAVYALQVDGLACPFCAYGIEKQLLAIEGVQTVETDIKSGAVIVTMAPGSTLDEELRASRCGVSRAKGRVNEGSPGQRLPGLPLCNWPGVPSSGRPTDLQHRAASRPRRVRLPRAVRPRPIWG